MLLALNNLFILKIHIITVNIIKYNPASHLAYPLTLHFPFVDFSFSSFPVDIYSSTIS